MNPLRNRWLFVGLVAELVVAGAIAFVPPVSDVFDVRNPGWIAALTPLAALAVLSR